MNDTDFKTAPSGGPGVQLDRNDLIARIREDPGGIEASARLSISGGLRSEAYHFDFQSATDGQASCAMRCNLSERHIDPRPLDLDRGDHAKLIQTLLPMIADGEVVRGGGFPPDSLIGKLELRIGGEVFTWLYMADPGQAETVGYEPPAVVARATDMIFGLAEKLTEQPNLRP